jgi:hypothetical protein
VGRKFGDYAETLLFAPGTDQALIDMLNTSLLSLHEKKNMETLRIMFTETGSCDDDFYFVQNLTIDRVGGLWVVWGFTVVIVFVIRWMLKRTN